MDIQEFLSKYSLSELKEKKVLNSSRNLLNSKSLIPLIEILKSEGIEELTSHGWRLDIYGDFKKY